MASGGGTDGFRKCIRFLMVLANLLILIGALSVMGVGIWTAVDKSYLEILMRNELYMSAAWVLVAVGAITIILSLIGCTGSLTEKRLLLLFYFIFVLLMFVVLLIGGVLAYVFRAQISSTMKPEMLVTIREYNPADPDPVSKAWDATQNKLKCCGVETNSTIGRPWEAWQTNKHINSGSANKKVPESCCLFDANSLRVDCQSDDEVDTSKIYTSDCFAAALIFVKGHSIVVGGVAVGIAAIMILGMVFSICHYKLIEKST